MESDIINKEKYPNCIKLTVKFEYYGKEYQERFGFSYSQIEDGSWKEHVEKWEEDVKSRDDVDLNNLSAE